MGTKWAPIPPLFEFNATEICEMSPKGIKESEFFIIEKPNAAETAAATTTATTTTTMLTGTGY